MKTEVLIIAEIRGRLQGLLDVWDVLDKEDIRARIKDIVTNLDSLEAIKEDK